MSVTLEVEEIAEGDYSPEYGTVSKVTDHGLSVTIEFKNGKSIMVDKGNEMEIDQGGRFVHNGESVG